MSTKLEILYIIRRHLIGLLRAVEQLIKLEEGGDKSARNNS